MALLALLVLALPARAVAAGPTTAPVPIPPAPVPVSVPGPAASNAAGGIPQAVPAVPHSMVGAPQAAATATRPAALSPPAATAPPSGGAPPAVTPPVSSNRNAALPGAAAPPVAPTGGVAPVASARQGGSSLPVPAAAAPPTGTSPPPAPPAAGTSSNQVVIVRVFSPGDDGAIVQANGPTGGISVTNAAPAAGASSGTPGAPAAPSGSTPASGLTPPSNWNWTWNWCGAPGRPVAAAADAGATRTGWNWTWNWSPTCPTAAAAASVGAPKNLVAVGAPQGAVEPLGYRPQAPPLSPRHHSARTKRRPATTAALASHPSTAIASVFGPSVGAARRDVPLVRHLARAKARVRRVAPPAPLQAPGPLSGGPGAAVASAGSAPSGLIAGLVAMAGFLISIAPLGRRVRPRRPRRQRPQASRLEHPG